MTILIGTNVGPTVVEVQFRLTQIDRVDAKLGTMAVHGYLRSWWHDPRLAFAPQVNGGCLDVVNIPGMQRNSPLWTPDLYIDNLVSRDMDNTDSLTQISSDGSVWRSEQAVLVLKMSFDLGKLPFDSHIAHVTMASYSQNISGIRLVAKGGAIDAAESGEGVKALPLKSVAWSFDDNGENVEASGFITPGKLQIIEGWDYLQMSWSIARKPRYFLIQVVVPCTLFLLVSYIQFFVDANAAPARAALAVIPVLIMRTMSNFIYKSIPEGSQSMWLDDFVTTSMFLCVFAAIHFSVVQYLKILEKKKAAKLVGLRQTKDIARRLTDIAKSRKVPLITLLQKFAPVEKELSQVEINAAIESARKELDAMNQEEIAEGVEAQEVNVADATPDAQSQSESAAQSNMHRVKVRSDAAKSDKVTEADLLFIMYAKDIFGKYDTDASKKVSPFELRGLLTYFNIYMSQKQVDQSMCRLLRDLGNPTPVDESKASLNFSQFVTLLVQIERYSIKRPDGLLQLKAYFQGIAPSERWDVIARFGFPTAIAFQFVIFFALIPAY